MNRFRALLNAIVPKTGKGKAAKLGSEDDPIRRMLFASQSLQEQAARIQSGTEGNPFQTIAAAAALAREGKRAEALAALRALLEQPQLETRLVLWIWAALRELGEMPDTHPGSEVLGVILEVRSGGGYDTLAAYSDGSARYLNFSGSAIFWDRPDAGINELCQMLLQSSVAARGKSEPRQDLSLPRNVDRVTLLTRSGLHAVTGIPPEVFSAGAALMAALIRRSQNEKR